MRGMQGDEGCAFFPPSLFAKTENWEEEIRKGQRRILARMWRRH